MLLRFDAVVVTAMSGVTFVTGLRRKADQADLSDLAEYAKIQVRPKGGVGAAVRPGSTRDDVRPNVGHRTGRTTAGAFVRWVICVNGSESESATPRTQPSRIIAAATELTTSVHMKLA